MNKAKRDKSANSDPQNLEKQRIEHALKEGGSVSEEGSSYAQSLADGDSGLARVSIAKLSLSDPEPDQ